MSSSLARLRGAETAITARPHAPPAMLTLRDQVITPILAGVRNPRRGRKPATWTRIDRDYETLRIGMQALFHDPGITASTAPTA